MILNLDNFSFFDLYYFFSLLYPVIMSYLPTNLQLSLPPELLQWHSSLLQVHLLRTQLKQQKLQDHITYQFLKAQVSSN